MNYLDLKIARRIDDIERIRLGGFPFPKSLTIYPSEVCNLNCPGCNSKHIHKKNGFMKQNIFLNIINDFRSFGGKAVAFEGGGEPMLHPGIDKMLTACRDADLKIGIITNGTIFKKEMLYADWIRVSIPDPNNILSSVERNIERLMSDRVNTKIGIKLLRNKLCIFPKISLQADYIQIKNLRNHHNSLIKNPDYVQPCGLTPLRAVVDYDGTFYPCPYFYAQRNTAIGKGLLSELWGSDEHKKAIHNIKNCNLYDCPMLDISWPKIRKADLNFL